MTIQRTMFFATLAGQLPASGLGARRPGPGQANDPLAFRMKRAGSTRCEFHFTTFSRRSSCQAFDADGNALGDPVTTEGYDYVAYIALGSIATATTGATSCAELGEFAEANAIANDETAATLLDWFETFGVTGGGLVGAVIELECNQMGLFDTPPSPPDNPTMPNPPGDGRVTVTQGQQC